MEIVDIPKLSAGRLPLFYTTTEKFEIGKDIDVFCASSRTFAKTLSPILKDLHIPGAFFRVKRVGRGHIQLDFRELSSGRVLLRIDLHDFEFFRRLGYSPDLARQILDQSIEHPSPTLLSGNVKPLPQHLALLKLGIYWQSFWLGTDKLQHVTWLTSNLNSKEIEELIALASKQTLKRPRLTRKGNAIELLAAVAIFVTSASTFIRLQHLKRAALALLRSRKKG